MKIIKNRYLIAAVCFFAAAVVSFVLLPRFYASRQATASVYRMAVGVPRGTLLEAKHIASAEVGAFNLPESVMTDPSNIIGQYALTDMPKDDLILPDKIGEFLHTETLDNLMKQDKRLVTVTLPSTAAGVSGHLEAGDIVSVVCYVEAHERLETNPQTGFDLRVTVPAETVSLPELQSIAVFGIENAKTENVEDSRESDQRSTDPVPKTVTLIVTEEQALKLVEAEYTGKIHLIFERRGA